EPLLKHQQNRRKKMELDREFVLDSDPRQAVEEMIKITAELEARIEIESNAVASNDGTTFTTNEMNKEYVSELYERAAAEFRTRLAEFKQVDKALLDKLQEAQESLRQSTENNLGLLAKMQDEADPQG
ncbi:MAG: hypothetical protein AAGB32_01045, partial [Pseudomonadota bacterium]